LRIANPEMPLSILEGRSESLKFSGFSSKLILSEKISRKVVESYGRSKERKMAFIEDSDFNLLSLNQQQDCLLITGKRKASAWGFSMRQNSSIQSGIGLDVSMRNIADVAIGDMVVIEKVTPLAGERVILKPVVEIIPGISTRVTEYIPFGIKDNPLVIGERIWYAFDSTTFVFDVVDIQPQNADAIVVSKNTIFAIEEPSKS
jgi:hypothetical protein